MQVLLQRVSAASVTVDTHTVGAIERGLLVFLGVDHGDTESIADRLCDKLLAYRVFPDAQGKMNLSVTDIDAQVLLVSQFTLSANTNKGLRPSFANAAAPPRAELLYEYFAGRIVERLGAVVCGQFGADMQVQLTNDGPVTFLLHS